MDQKIRNAKRSKSALTLLVSLLITLSLFCSSCAFLPSLNNTAQDSGGVSLNASDKFDPSAIRPYSDSPFYTVADGTPFFSAEELSTKSFEKYGELDRLGRCTYALACIAKDTMPTEERGSISSVKPSGWQSVKYDIVDGKYLYNRCHLIGWQLTAENANENNLITGTRYLNVEGMLPFENMVADYVKETGNHVMYRVTPVYEGDELVARGVLMEAYSVEDNGEGICFCVYCYNVQPGIVINYKDGTSTLSGKEDSDNGSREAEGSSDQIEYNYVLNTNSKVFHYDTCSSASSIAEHNKKSCTATRDEMIADGYSPCGKCKP